MDTHTREVLVPSYMRQPRDIQHITIAQPFFWAPVAQSRPNPTEKLFGSKRPAFVQRGPDGRPVVKGKGLTRPLITKDTMPAPSGPAGGFQPSSSPSFTPSDLPAEPAPGVPMWAVGLGVAGVAIAVGAAVWLRRR